jgi:hypothetical protein
MILSLLHVYNIQINIGLHINNFKYERGIKMDLVKFSVYVEIARIIIYIITALVVYVVINRIISNSRSKIAFDIDNEMMKIKYNEDDIMKHLKWLIERYATRYQLYNLEAKEIVYINDEIENQWRTYVTENVTRAIPKSLKIQLSLIYNDDIMWEVVGEEIYDSITNLRLVYNEEHFIE